METVCLGRFTLVFSVTYEDLSQCITPVKRYTASNVSHEANDSANRRHFCKRPPWVSLTRKHVDQNGGSVSFMLNLDVSQ